MSQQNIFEIPEIYALAVAAVDNDQSGEMLRQIRQECDQSTNIDIGGVYGGFADSAIDRQNRSMRELLEMLFARFPEQLDEILTELTSLPDVELWNVPNAHVWQLFGFGLIDRLAKANPKAASRLVSGSWLGQKIKLTESIADSADYAAMFEELARNLLPYDIAVLVEQADLEDFDDCRDLMILAVFYSSSTLESWLLDVPWRLKIAEVNRAWQLAIGWRSELDGEFARRWQYLSESYADLPICLRLRHPLIGKKADGWILAEESPAELDVEARRSLNIICGECPSENQLDEQYSERQADQYAAWGDDLDRFTQSQSSVKEVKAIDLWACALDNGFSPMGFFNIWGVRQWNLAALLHYHGLAVLVNEASDSWQVAGILASDDGSDQPFHIVEWVYPTSTTELFLSQLAQTPIRYRVLAVDSTPASQEIVALDFAPVFPLGDLRIHLRSYPVFSDQIYPDLLAEAVNQAEYQFFCQLEQDIAKFEYDAMLKLAKLWPAGEIDCDLDAASQFGRFSLADVAALLFQPRTAGGMVKMSLYRVR